MPHGTPDWGLTGPKETTFGLDDLGEHAVRLGSPHLFDRQGDALTLEDFRNGMGPFFGDGSGALWNVVLSTGHTRQGAYSVKLITGSTVNREADLLIHIAYPRLTGIGLEFTFSLDEDTQYIQGVLTWDDGALIREATVVYDLPNAQLWVVDRTLGWRVFTTGIPLETGDQPMHVLKLVADMTTGMYVRCILNNVVYDLSAWETQSGVSIYQLLLRAEIRHYANIADNLAVWIDNVIVTQNEP